MLPLAILVPKKQTSFLREILLHEKSVERTQLRIVQWGTITRYLGESLIQKENRMWGLKGKRNLKENSRKNSL